MPAAAALRLVDRNRGARQDGPAQREARRQLESLGWLVVACAEAEGPFDLYALPSSRSRPVAGLGVPMGRWLGISVRQREEGAVGPGFERDELRELARTHGGKACFAVRAAGRGRVRLRFEN